MSTLVAQKSTVSGTVALPSSKSQSLRALLFASLAKEKSTVTNLLPSTDVKSMIEAIIALGASVEGAFDTMTIQPGALRKDRVINAGNSGIILRFIGACATLFPGITAITGDESIRMRRPVKPLIDALRSLGAEALGAREDSGAPLYVSGSLRGGRASIEGSDSQPISGLLIACALSTGIYELHVNNPKETPWIDVTLDWLRRFEIPIFHNQYTQYTIQGGHTIPGFTYSVPGDLSTLLFPVTAALLTGTSLTITNVSMDDAQGDKAVIDFLQACGAQISCVSNTMHVLPSTLHGGEFDLDTSIDSLPILSVLATTMSSPLTLYNGAVARHKESDRINAMTTSLKKMGAQIEERADGMVIHPSRLTGASLISYNDHRIAMSLLIAGLIAEGETHVRDCDCIQKTYPTFLQDMIQLGAKLRTL